MNWTGGILDRSRNANSSLTAQQKAYFAKARGRPNTTHASPPTFDIFENISFRGGTTIGEQANQAVVHVKPSTRVGENTHGNSQRRGLTSHLRSKESTPVKYEASISRVKPQPFVRDSTRRSPIIISSRQSSISAFKEDGYALLASQIERRSRQTRHDRQDPRPSATEYQRDRLLNMRDWVGISHTKPAKVGFTDFHDRDQIGKRRQLSNMKHQIHKPKHQCFKSRLRRREEDISAPNEVFSQADISVRIGSVVDREVTQSVRERRMSSKMDHASAVSDEMLLDETFSDKTVSSQNPFRECRPAIEVNPIHQPRDFQLTPFSPVDQFPYLEMGLKNDHMSRVDHKTCGIQEDFIDNRQGPQLWRHSDEVGLIEREPSEEDAANRFIDEPPPRNSGSRSKIDSQRDQNADFEFSKDSKRITSKGTQLYLLEAATSIRDDSPIERSHLNEPSQSHQTKNSLGWLSNESSVHAYLVDRPEEDSPQAFGQAGEINRKAVATGMTASRPLSQPPANLEDINFHRTSDNEEAAWKIFINKDPPVKPLQNETLDPAISLPMEINQPVLNVCTTHGASTTQEKVVKDARNEDEALWRNFVFGGVCSSLDWLVEPWKGEGAMKTQEDASAEVAAQTQLSTQAEMATSPVKQNAHLVEEATSSSQGAVMEQASQIATASSTLPANTNSNEISETNYLSTNTLIHTSPNSNSDPNEDTPPSPSSTTAQPPTSPPTSTTLPTKSSLPIQPQPPLSSDELSWSPARLSLSHSTAPAPASATSKQSVIFKKPARYVGKRALEPRQPVRLGGKRKGMSKIRGKMGKGRSRGKMLGKGGVEDEDEEGGMWEIGGVEDDIEDF